MWPWIGIGVAGLAVLVGGLTLVGAWLPRAHVAAVAATFRTDAEALFAALADDAGQAAWRRDVRAVERIADRDGHAVFVYRDSHGGRLPLERLETVAPRRLVGRVVDDGLPFGGTWTVDLAPDDGGGTRVTITEAGFVKPPLVRVFSRLFSMTATAERTLVDLGRKFGETVTPAVVRAR